MAGKTRLFVAIVIVYGSASVSAGARIRPGGDPPSSTVIWADPFDNYSQWAKDNGNEWPGGPTPAGVTGGYVPKGGTGNNGCAGEVQMAPAQHEMLRAQWTRVMECGVQTSKSGQAVEPGYIEAQYVGDDLCADWVDPLGKTAGYWAVVNHTWGRYGVASSMQQFEYDLSPRIQEMNANRGEGGLVNAVQATDSHPLVLTFYLLDDTLENYHGPYDNMYVELSLAGDHAPTDFIWRGNPAADYWDDEYCPRGPYPVICQQAREVNSSMTENSSDLYYLNSHCPPPVPRFDSATGQGRTWMSLAFGMMAIMDKDPCGNRTAGIDAHCPTTDYYAVFDGNVWRQIRGDRYAGLDGLSSGATSHQSLPFPPDASMAVGAGSCNGFSILPGTTRVFIKITSEYMLIYADNLNGPDADDYYPAWHAAVPRQYKGPFDRISIGVGPGCELDPTTYTCKAGGTPRQCLMYSNPAAWGYSRFAIDSMALYGGDVSDPCGCWAACCQRDGTCVANVTPAACTAINGTYHGNGSSCQTFLCCPTPFADADHDGDVDQDDFGAFQICYTGAGGGVPTGCGCFDRNQDGDVDKTDFIAFGNCWVGPNVPWSQSLTPSCTP